MGNWKSSPFNDDLAHGIDYLDLLGVREESTPEEIVDAVRKQIAGLDINFLGRDMAADQARRLQVAANTLIGTDRDRYLALLRLFKGDSQKNLDDPGTIKF